MSSTSVPVQWLGVDPGKREPKILPLNTTLPNKFRGFGFESGRHHSTTIQESIRGEETRTPGWSKHVRRFQVNQNLGKADIDELREFLLLTRGGLNTFYVEDPFDFSSAADHRGTPSHTDQMIGWGDSSNKVFQITKRYSQTQFDQSRYEISRNAIGITNLSVAVNGQLRVRAHSTLGYTFDRNNGLLTFNTAPTYGDVVTCGFNYLCLCRFDIANDWLQVTHDAFDHGTVSLNVVEVKDAVPVEERMSFGGDNLVVMGSKTIHMLDATAGFFTFVSTNSASTIYLPTIRGSAPTVSGVQKSGTTTSYSQHLTIGGPYFCIYNLSAYTITLKERIQTTTDYPFYRHLLANSLLGELHPNTARRLYIAHADSRKEITSLDAQVWVAV